MRVYVRLTLAAFFVCATYSAFAQTVPTATEGNSPWAIGAGISGYNTDYESGRLFGGTLWIDYRLTKVPSLLQGLAIEGEARDLNYLRSATEESNLRQDTAGGGLIYSWRHFAKLRPYAKAFAGYGNTDEGWKDGWRNHDSRNFLAVGGGVEYRIMRHIWARADYEYQSWPDMFFNGNLPSGRMNPQGVTVGAMYHFSRPRHH
ncbi:MAG: porin family protein [Terracidiphilus sp.]